MSIEKAIYAKLNDESGTVGNYVGTSTSARIFPGRVPQGQALPAIRYQRIASTHYTHLGGVTGLEEAIYQVDCYAATYDTMVSLAEAVQTSLQNYRGTKASTVIEVTLLEAKAEQYLAPIDASDTGRWVTSLDFRFIFEV